MTLTDVSARLKPLCTAKTHGQLFKCFHCLPVGASGGLKTRAWLEGGGWQEHDNRSGGGTIGVERPKLAAANVYQNLGTGLCTYIVI